MATRSAGRQEGGDRKGAVGTEPAASQLSGKYRLLVKHGRNHPQRDGREQRSPTPI